MFDLRGEAIPSAWQGRTHIQAAVLYPDTEDPLGHRTVEPACGAGIPCPAAASCEGAFAVDVSGNDIRFDAVAFCRGRIPRMANRIEEFKATQGVIAAA